MPENNPLQKLLTDLFEATITFPNDGLGKGLFSIGYDTPWEEMIDFRAELYTQIITEFAEQTSMSVETRDFIIASILEESEAALTGKLNDPYYKPEETNWLSDLIHGEEEIPTPQRSLQISEIIDVLVEAGNYEHNTCDAQVHTDSPALVRDAIVGLHQGEHGLNRYSSEVLTSLSYLADTVDRTNTHAPEPVSPSVSNTNTTQFKPGM